MAICYLLLVSGLAVLGLHKTWMILLWWRGRQTKPADPELRSQDLPAVTVQLPIYNERFVVADLIRATAKLDYPHDRLEIQILDDSTDDTPDVVAGTLAELPSDLRVRHIRRDDRTGYKAGALEHGLHEATGELIAVFDADFIPPTDFLRRAVPCFADERVGLVQARWDHTNSESSVLTRVQALLLDGHFAIEQRARANNGCFFNFNGTAGLFRRQCIEDAGGWQHDTLTEDMDLSYRAQLKGWRFLYRSDLVCPAELPMDMNGFLTQQHRWAKGSIQTGRKLLGRIFAARLPLRTKIESVFHLLGNLAFPMLLALILVAMPLQLLRWLGGTPTHGFYEWVEAAPLVLATLSVFAYYGLSQVTLSRFTAGTLLRLPVILALGAGVSLNNTLAVCSALRRSPGEFLRTPKRVTPEDATRDTYNSPRGLLPLFEIGLGLWAATTSSLAILQGQWSSAGFHGLFATGLVWVGLRSIQANRRGQAALSPATP